MRYSLIDGQDSLHIDAWLTGVKGTQRTRSPCGQWRRVSSAASAPSTPRTATNTSRYSLSGAWQHTSGTSVTSANAYVIASRLDLFSDFTYFLNDPVHGDQFEQTDRRVTEAMNLCHAWLSTWGGRDGTEHRGPASAERQYRRRPRTTPRTGHFLSVVRSDRVMETSEALYYQDSIPWLEKFRTEAGVRADFYRFGVNSDNPANSGTVDARIDESRS